MSNPAEEFNLKMSGPDHELTAVWSRPFGGTNERSTTIEVDPLRLRTIDVLVGLLRRNRLLEDNELKLLGEHLFVTLFQTSKGTDNGPGALLRQAIKGKREPDESGERMLRVSLEFDSDNEKFASWPWEYLFVPPVPGDPDSNFFLSWSTKLVLTRRMSLNTTSRDMHYQPPLKVLLAVLSPHGHGLVPVVYEPVMKMFIDLRDSEPTPRFRLWVFSPGHAQDGTPYPPDTDDPERTSYPAFADVVSRFNPHLIHIIGHGRYIQRGDQGAYGQLAFPKDHTEPQWVNDWEIATELMENDDLRLVFFQACETAATSSHPYQAISGMAHSLAQKNIPAVIGMHFQVKSAMANKFARDFYQPLMQQKPIEVAMHAGRRALRL
ncbi:CHAT domain-containing protein, partial [Kibdelosporangium lantanae]